MDDAPIAKVLSDPDERIPPDVPPLRRRHSTARYYLLDWPWFLVKCAAAWYMTLIGVMGAFLIALSAIMLVRCFVFERFLMLPRMGRLLYRSSLAARSADFGIRIHRPNFT